EYTTGIETLIPEEDVPTYTEQTVTVHYRNTDNWQTVNGFIKQGGAWDKLAGYDYNGEWPGEQMTADSVNAGYYTVTFTMPVEELHVIFNNGSGAQTENINITTKTQVSEYWVSGNGTDLTTTAPDRWVESAPNELNKTEAGGQGEAGDSDTATEYTYNVYFFDANEEHMSTSAADLWSWSEPGATLLNEATPFTALETLADGNKWLKAQIITKAGKLGLIPRSIGEWKWQTANHYAQMPEGVTSMDVYIVFGDDANTYTSLPTLKEQRKRYVLVDYTRPNNDYEGWNLYSWNTGLASETNIEAKDLEGDRMITVPVKDSSKEFAMSFCMRRSEASNAWAEKDGGDHNVMVPADQTVVKAVFLQGQGIVRTLPYNKGYEMKAADDTISFYYREDALMLTNTEASLSGKVQLKVSFKADSDETDSTVESTYDMDYDAENERYFFDLTDATSGEYTYYYLVDGAKVIDRFNSNSTESGSKIDYKKIEGLELKAGFNKDTINSRENAVLTVDIEGEGLDEDKITSLTADLSALGLGEMVIEKEAMAVAVAVKDSVSTGLKEIPVKLTDVYGNIYTTSASIEVTAKPVESFDWDEAVIYFAVTDRFYD
ncbi:MAG: starch-binding protein, partial [Bacteroidaceae bacterium]|nr:starch-binding protein [Bacteroidaceae bacterium]